MKCVRSRDKFSSGGGDLHPSSLSSMALGEGSSVKFRSTAAAGKPSSISLGEGSVVNNWINAASDGSKTAGIGPLASCARDVEVDS